MPFEFDPQKSASNKLKHGIDFVEAQALWQSPRIKLNGKGCGGKTLSRHRHHQARALERNHHLSGG